MRLTTIRYLVSVSALVLTLMLVACGGGDEPDAPAPTAEPADSQSSEAVPTKVIVEGEPTLLGDCQGGMTMQPGEGCQYSGHEGRPGDIVISVGADGSICREKGSVMMSGFMVNVVRACDEEYAVIDVLEAEINFEPNGDGSWRITTNQ